MAFVYVQGQAVHFQDSHMINKCGEDCGVNIALPTDKLNVQLVLTPVDGVQVLTDNDFTAGTGWTFGGDWTYDGANDLAECAGAGALTHNTYTVEAMKYYKAVIAVSAYTGGNLTVEGITVIDSSSNYTVGEHTVYFLGDGNAFALDANGLGIEITQVDLYVMSSPGLRLVDCTDESVAWEEYDDLVTSGILTFYEISSATTGYTGVPFVTISLDWLSDMGVSDGCYKLCIVDAYGNIEGDPSVADCELETCCYTVKATHTGSVLMYWYNNDNIEVGGTVLNYAYSAWYQYLRIPAEVSSVKWTTDMKRYDYSSGLKELTSARVVETVELKTHNIAENQHRAIAYGLGHKYYYIDAVRHFLDDTEYEPRWRRDVALSAATVQLQRVYNTLHNSYCTPVLFCEQEVMVIVNFQNGENTIDILLPITVELLTEATDGSSTFTYNVNGGGAAAFSSPETWVTGDSVEIIRSSATGDEILTLTGFYS